MKKYAVWFQDSHVICLLQGKDSSDVRNKFNRNIKIKELKDALHVEGEKGGE